MEFDPNYYLLHTADLAPIKLLTEETFSNLEPLPLFDNLYWLTGFLEGVVNISRSNAGKTIHSEKNYRPEFFLETTYPEVLALSLSLPFFSDKIPKKREQHVVNPIYNLSSKAGQKFSNFIQNLPLSPYYQYQIERVSGNNIYNDEYFQGNSNSLQIDALYPQMNFDFLAGYFAGRRGSFSISPPYGTEDGYKFIVTITSSQKLFIESVRNLLIEEEIIKPDEFSVKETKGDERNSNFKIDLSSWGAFEFTNRLINTGLLTITQNNQATNLRPEALNFRQCGETLQKFNSWDRNAIAQIHLNEHIRLLGEHYKGKKEKE